MLVPAACFAQNDPKPRRLKVPAGRKTVIARGLVGGEVTDYYLIHVEAGRRLIVRSTSRLKRTQVHVSAAAEEDALRDAPDRSDLTRWEGNVPRTGDYLISVNVYPGGEHYTLVVGRTLSENGSPPKSIS